MKTAYQYIRISNEDQSNFSISGQKMLNEDWAKRNDITIIETFVDDGFSAKDFNRPEWIRLSAKLAKSKIDYLIVSKYDRLIRNLTKGLTFVELLEQKFKITLISVLENYSIDITDPYFFKHRADMFVDADFERRRISDRTKMGIWSAKSQGTFLGKAPYGYTNIQVNEKPVLSINQEESRIVEIIYDNYINGVPLASIMRIVQKEGFPMTAKEAIKRVLSNHVYAGLIKVRAYKKDPDKISKGSHTPIITETAFWKAQDRLKSEVKPVVIKFLDEKLPLRGFLKCEHCDAPHTGAGVKGRSQYYHYYWCSKCRGNNYKTEKVNADVMEILKTLSFKKEFIGALKEEARQEHDRFLKSTHLKLDVINKQYDELNTNIDSLEAKFIANEIDSETYKKWKIKHVKSLTDISAEKDMLKSGADKSYKLFNDNIDYFCDLGYLYQKCCLEDKQPFMRGIFPDGLIASKTGYRTALIQDMFYTKAISEAGLLTINTNGSTAYSYNAPIGVGSATTIEPLLLIINKLKQKIA